VCFIGNELFFQTIFVDNIITSDDYNFWNWNGFKLINNNNTIYHVILNLNNEFTLNCDRNNLNSVHTYQKTGIIVYDLLSRFNNLYRQDSYF